MDQQPTRDTVARIMREMDLCFMATKDGERLCSRPMSNNRDVDWDGDNWFFSNADTRKITQLRKDPTVMLDFSRDKDWISLRGRAELHENDRQLFADHWVDDLARWFEQGIDTPGLVLIRVKAEEAELFGASGEGIVDLRG